MKRLEDNGPGERNIASTDKDTLRQEHEHGDGTVYIRQTAGTRKSLPRRGREWHDLMRPRLERATLDESQAITAVRCGWTYVSVVLMPTPWSKLQAGATANSIVAPGFSLSTNGLVVTPTVQDVQPLRRWLMTKGKPPSTPFSSLPAHL